MIKYTTMQELGSGDWTGFTELGGHKDICEHAPDLIQTLCHTVSLCCTYTHVYGHVLHPHCNF